MSGRKAKALRRAVYGDLSLKAPRAYMRASFGTIINHPQSLRAIYQSEKRNLGTAP